MKNKFFTPGFCGFRCLSTTILLRKTTHKFPSKEAFADAKAMVIIMKQIEYKGYIIDISYHPSETNPYRAEISNGEGHWGETEEDAIRLIKSHIDAIPIFREISFQPMKQYEIDAIKTSLKDNRSTIFIKRQLVRSNYITSNDKVYIDPKFLYYHSDELQKLLSETEGYAVNLKSAEYCIGTRSYFFAYDADVFNTDRAVFELKQQLAQKQLEEEV